MCYNLPMTRIGVRELRQHASRYLEQVKAGEVVEVTERGKLVALLVSPTPAVAVRDQLIASGRLVPAKSSFQLPERRRVAGAEASGTEVLAEQRRDRLG
jgi:prevent-host-death family protein